MTPNKNIYSQTAVRLAVDAEWISRNAREIGAAWGKEAVSGLLRGFYSLADELTKQARRNLAEAEDYGEPDQIEVCRSCVSRIESEREQVSFAIAKSNARKD